MASVVKQQILEAVQAALVAAALVPIDRVYLDRTDELPEDDLSAIDILGGDAAGEESIQYQTVHFPSIQQRSYSFEIASIARGLTGAAKAARNLAGSVEATLCASASTITVGGRSIDLLLAEESEVKLPGGNSTPFVSVRQTWQAQYMTSGNDPTVPL